MDRLEDADILAKTAQWLDLPMDVVAGFANIELMGNRQIFISKHCGILGYSNEEIDVNCGKMFLKVKGKNLSLIAMNEDELRIGGIIEALLLEG